LAWHLCTRCFAAQFKKPMRVIGSLTKTLMTFLLRFFYFAVAAAHARIAHMRIGDLADVENLSTLLIATVLSTSCAIGHVPRRRRTRFRVPRRFLRTLVRKSRLAWSFLLNSSSSELFEHSASPFAGNPQSTDFAALRSRIRAGKVRTLCFRMGTARSAGTTLVLVAAVGSTSVAVWNSKPHPTAFGRCSATLHTN
jgi:hypothetical protein